MTRRTWRDLTPNTDSGNSGAAGGAAAPDPAAELHRAASMAPDGRLSRLIAEREVLENRLRGLSGGGAAEDPAIAARFPVASTAERRAEEAAWQLRRATQLANHSATEPATLANRAAGAVDDPFGTLSNLADTPLARRMGQGLASFGNGASGLNMPRSRHLDQGLDALDHLGRPLRQLGSSVNNARNQLRDLDRQLADKDVSERDRDEIRKTLKGDTLDKVGKKLDQANSALAAPRRAADRLEQGWNRRRAQIESPMDRLSSYAERREQRLGTDTGGSGDLFERMQANRMRALQRQQEARREEERDQRRRDRAAQNRREQQREEERLDR